MRKLSGGEFTTIRWAISTIILWGFLAINKKQLPIFLRWKEFMILGFLGIFAFLTLNYLGLRSISASQAGMISAGIPITILVFTPFFLEEKIKRVFGFCGGMSESRNPIFQENGCGKNGFLNG
ncbi:DMT family transporter [Paenibacillus sp. 7124]|uniref:DMT family transporter n=1 Tax=Paenibacillus apii TaxID=1850370 RepID=A0A6M1PLM6_9BACL|nr:DMT family transporter [Paenibacillus apii]NGM84379.1 DMT family transporter [Paenibacillus apii]NJJ38329.1 DMT family transporter [Paenibacillus apii]